MVGWPRVASHILGCWPALCWVIEGDWGTCLSPVISKPGLVNMMVAGV